MACDDDRSRSGCRSSCLPLWLTVLREQAPPPARPHAAGDLDALRAAIHAHVRNVLTCLTWLRRLDPTIFDLIPNVGALLAGIIIGIVALSVSRTSHPLGCLLLVSTGT